jgi:hypothetical protein
MRSIPHNARPPALSRETGGGTVRKGKFRDGRYRPAADAVNVLDALRFRHLVSRLHAAGPRPTGELLTRLTRLEPSITTSLLRVLEELASVDVKTIKRIGADRWPPAIFAVPDEIRAGLADRDTILRRSLNPTDGKDAA